MFIPQFCLVHTLDFGAEWFDVYPGWLYGEYKKEIFDKVRLTGKIRMFRGDMEVVIEIEHYESRCSGRYYCYLNEWKIMKDDLLRDNVKRGLSNDAIVSLEEIVKMFYE